MPPPPKVLITRPSPLLLLIDPVLQVIEKKQYRYHGFDNFEADSIFEILGVGDRMFFICGYVPAGPTALVSEASPDMATGRFTLHLPRRWVRCMIYLHQTTSTYT